MVPLTLLSLRSSFFFKKSWFDRQFRSSQDVCTMCLKINSSSSWVHRSGIGRNQKLACLFANVFIVKLGPYALANRLLFNCRSSFPNLRRRRHLKKRRCEPELWLKGSS